MLRSAAKIAVHFDLDNVANRWIEAFYSNDRKRQNRFARRFQILEYHKVSTDPHPFFAPVPPAVFEAQMRFLSRCYKVMPLFELVERNRRGDLPERAVAITFDDGYRDNYEFAFPILAKYGLPATIFIATGSIETGVTLWHDRVFDSFRFATVERASLHHLGFGELPLETLKDRELSLNTVLRKAKELYGEERMRFVEEIEKALKPDLPVGRDKRMLTWQQILEMHRSGIEIGSHTVTHPVLSRLPLRETVKELRESKETLSEVLDAPISSFAYPNGHAGDYNDEVKSLLKETGYACAATSEWGINDTFSDPFELRRGQPWHSEIELFRLAFFLQRHGLN